MRKMMKKMMTILTAGAMVVSGAALAACGGNFKTPAGGPAAGDPVASNGGFVVEKGNYFYFINGVESNESDNTYGTPVKGALMRVEKSKLGTPEGNAGETVIPSLMVAADYTSGIYIYGDRIYYATPNNVKNTSGEIERGYLDFKSAKLDGSDIRDIKQVSDNATVYRFVEDNNKVYLLYVTDSDLHSVDAETKTDTLLAADMGEYVLNSTDKTDATVYYTMSVSENIDSDAATELAYNQIYRVTASTTEAPAGYDYEWDKDYLEEHDDEAPYTNLGTIVLDGVGSTYAENPNRFSHDLDGVTPSAPAGYTYTLQSYNNEGIYFTRSDLTTTSTVGEDGWLYYLAESKLTSGWNSVSGNDKSNFDVIAQDTTDASSSAIFYHDEAGHHYLFTNSSILYRADVKENGNADLVAVARDSSLSSATLVRTEAGDGYDYVYYLSGTNVYRAVYSGTEEDRNPLNYDAAKPYLPVQILSISAASSWYQFEVIDDLLFFADSEAVGSSQYNYIAYVDLAKDGKLMNNEQLAAWNDEYAAAIGKDSYYQELTTDGKSTLATAVRYHFYTGSDEQFYANIEEAKTETGKDNTLYSEDEVADFAEYVKGAPKTRGSFVQEIGVKNTADSDAIGEYWKNTLEHYIAPTEENTGLPAWAWALIGVGIGIVVIGAGVAIFFLIRARNKSEEPKEEKMFVDTTDDEDVDVYADDSVAPVNEVEEPEETPAEAPEAESETESGEADDAEPEEGTEASEETSDQDRPEA